MENAGKKISENFVLADMHCNGVYFDAKILGAKKQEEIKATKLIDDNNGA